MNRDELLQGAKARLQQAFGNRLRGVILYGSEARGDARPDSDIDIMVLLHGPVHFLDDHSTCMHAIHDLVVRLAVEEDKFIDIKPVDSAEFDDEDQPLYLEAKREGVLV